jgi:hypothetical protein
MATQAKRFAHGIALAVGAPLTGAIAVVGPPFSGQATSPIEHAIEAQLEAVTSTASSLGDIVVTLAESSISVHGLTIANPPGYATRYALNVEFVDGAVDVPSLEQHVIHLPVVVFSGATIYVEQRGHQTNIAELLPQIRSTEGIRSRDDESSRRIIIDEVRLDSSQVVVTMDTVPESRTLLLDTLSINNIGRNGRPVTFEEATTTILHAVFDVASAALQVQLERSATEFQHDYPDGTSRR